jgi:SAM-dependent methyltransferase
LVGVDLSARMLEHAARRGVYERLERADLIEFLRANRGGFDVVVAGDVLCYFGDLGPFAQCALASLRAEGLLGFSVERAGEDELGDREESGYIIRHHGRYAHTCRHIKHAFRGGTLHLAEVALRLELGEAVGGYWVSAKRKGHARTIATRDAILDQLNAPDKKTQFAALEKVEYVGDRSLVKNVARLLDDPAPVTVWVAGGPHQVVLRLNDAAAKVIAVLLRQPFSFQLSSYRPCTDAEIQEIKAYLQSHRLLP